MTNEERRARLGVRQALVPEARVASAEAAAESVVALHATDPATAFLSYWARSRAPQAAELERALYRDRSLVKQLAMRRTLFVFPRDLLGAAWASASARVARAEGARVAREVERTGVADDGHGWLRVVRAKVLAALADRPDGLPAREIQKLVPEMGATLPSSGPLLPSSGPSLLSQVLTFLGANADILRGGNAGNWRTARPLWTAAEKWLGELPGAWTEAEGYRELVRRWLDRFGPGTEEDLVWWLGATRSAVRTALGELGAVEVSLEGGSRGWLLPDDVDEMRSPGMWVALLPLLDATVMGWRERAFYFERHRAQLFDRQGNAGTTVWVDGRVVGFWVQGAGNAVEVRLLERVSAAAQRMLRSEAKRLTEWLEGTRLAVVRSPAQMAESTKVGGSAAS